MHRRDDGSVSHLECATFVYTRVPYDPDVESPAATRDPSATEPLTPESDVRMRVR